MCVLHVYVFVCSERTEAFVVAVVLGHAVNWVATAREAVPRYLV
jgi:hypothetical protein